LIQRLLHQTAIDLPKYLADEELPPPEVISSFAHGKEWINSVRRAREFWLAGLQNANDRGIQAIFSTWAFVLIALPFKIRQIKALSCCNY
jgi:hypothetical protein